MNIYDFITDEEQYKLKCQACIGNDRFENVLIIYKELFFQELNKCSLNVLPVHLNQTLLQNQSVINWIICFNNTIQQEILLLKDLFEEVIYGYKLFLQGKHYYASLFYQDLLDKYNLLIDEDFDKLGVFYRGFWNSANRDSKDKMQYFHIPYNFRHLVGNQRFSFSGIPLIYLGSSIADVFYELGETNLDSKKIAIASFAFNPISSITIHQDKQFVQTKTRIFNITNEIYNLINRYFEPLIQGGGNIPDCNDLFFSPNSNDLKIFFRKFLISQICTFQKRYNSDKFIEEYVIPQLFTEALYRHKYDGIIFPSTRFYNQVISINNPPYNLGYKENLVMFTTYSQSNKYDEMLFSNFKINIKTLVGQRNNMQKTLINQISQDSKKNICEIFKKVNDSKRKRIIEGMIEATSRLMQYQNLTINGINYLDTRAGKLELIYMRDYMKYLSECIPYLNNIS